MKIGWREWASLPDLKIPLIKVKVDTGAKTSALHTTKTEVFTKHNKQWIRFWFNAEDETLLKVKCEAPIKDQRNVTNSAGASELRYVIETNICIGKKKWPIEVTLTNRKTMKFKMLLGRQGMKKITVKPVKSYHQNKPIIGTDQ